jgi:LysM repeat protein
VPREGGARRYVAPAAFLLAVTIAVVAVRAGLESGGPAAKTTRTTTSPLSTLPASTRRHIVTTKGKAYWRVRAGDTFGAISRATGVSVRTLERLNPKVSSTSLFIGEKVRIG